MSVETPKPNNAHLPINAEERAELISILEQVLGDTRVEARRTHTPDFREHVLHQEEVVRNLLEKLQRLQP